MVTETNHGSLKLLQIYSIFGQKVTKSSRAVGGIFLSFPLLLPSQSDLRELQSWENITIWWKLKLIVEVMLVCCHITLLLDSFPGYGLLTVLHSLSSGVFWHHLTAIICFSICEGGRERNAAGCVEQYILGILHALCRVAMEAASHRLSGRIVLRGQGNKSKWTVLDQGVLYRTKYKIHVLVTIMLQ